jgi:hypothetical protein
MRLRWLTFCLIFTWGALAPAGDAKKPGLDGSWHAEFEGKKMEMVFKVDAKPRPCGQNLGRFERLG